MQRFYNFGRFRLDAVERLLWRDGALVSLKPKVVETLLLLIEQRGRTIGKQELIEWLWPDTFVEEANLTQNIYLLRRALGEVIQTIPRRGYRFVAEVTAEGDEMTEVVVAERTRARIVIEEEETDENLSLAVLPFKSLTAAGEEHWGPGVAETLVARLSRVERLRVLPTAAIARLALQGADATAIGRALGVTALLDGAVQRAGDRVRVTVQLIDARSGAVQWAERFDELLTDLFEVEDRLAGQVARALALRLTGQEERLLKRGDTDNLAAYQFFMEGEHNWQKMSPEGFKRAIECFQRAVELDPQYALAQVGLAATYAFLGIYGLLPPRVAMPQAETMACRALELDATVGQAHLVLGVVCAQYDLNLPEAEREVQHALALNPRDWEAHHYYAFCLSAGRRFDEAMAELNCAEKLNPGAPQLAISRLALASFTGQSEQAVAGARQIIKHAPTFHSAYRRLGEACLRLREFDAASVAFDQARRLSHHSMYSVAGLGIACARTGRQQEAEKILAELQASANQALGAAWVAFALGRIDDGFVWLERAFDERAGDLIFLDVDCYYDDVRSDARFAALRQRVRFG